MEARKAKEIVEAAKIFKGGDYGETTFAQGYLAALSGPEVKALVLSSRAAYLALLPSNAVLANNLKTAIEEISK